VRTVAWKAALCLPLVTLLLLGGPGTPAGAVRARDSAAAAAAADCQPFGARPCLEPFPNNLFTRPDRSSPTGLRVHLPAGAMPRSRTGQRVSVAPYDRADGFSPGSAAIVHVPGLDNPAALARTGAAGVLDIGRSLRPGQPIVMIDEKTGRRVALFSELDANATSPAATDLLIHPAAALANGHTSRAAADFGLPHARRGGHGRLRWAALPFVQLRAVMEKVAIGDQIHHAPNRAGGERRPARRRTGYGGRRPLGRCGRMTTRG
jgi:hypothetical protein